MQSQRDELIGATLGNYRILAPLGQGGMARVYRARQENLDREVAIKVLPPWYASDRSFVERFNLEARLVARLSHPNIVTVHDASEYNGLLYIVMQLVDGGTLKQRLDQLRAQGKTMDLHEAALIFRQIADALSYAHDQGIIHRDVKPVNVLMDRSGRPILSDFGIAKVLASSHEQLTRPGAGVGTPEYMSPEQCMGGQVDGRADIYALGVMLFEALTGRTPFIGDNYPALAHSHLYEPPPPPSRFNPALPAPVERVILTALMKDPAQRYQRASELADALDLAIHATGRLPAYQREHPSPPARSPAQAAPGLPAGARTPQPRTTSYLCPNCQHLNRPQMRYCTRCGCPLNQCPACGRINPASNRFCTACGHALSAVPV
ncbi:serine/threonine-protein kinase [Thermogemmatispora sp.]|uniref:serine/threonine-protein kinase n=1 Tax=Thermogemmatispora sp. TaxID=1968838 RepID=UPI001DD2C8E0|nr:serine/threonine-protein kinase [Thermogemmatispora sp.]MBX5451133.1 protein kinase [Thermogemmatispora sp.]